MSSASRIAEWPLALALGLALAGCVPGMSVPSPSAGLRSAMSDMEVRVVHASVAEAPDRPISGAGEGAAVGAARGAGGSLYMGAQACQDPFSCVIGLTFGVVMAPVAGLVGAAVGGAKAHSSEEVSAAHDRFLRAAAELDPVRGLQDAFAAAQPRLGPATAAAPAEHAVRLEVAIENFGLASEGDYEPDVTLVMSVRGRVLRGAHNEELYWRLWYYEGAKMPYFSLAAGAPDSLEAMADKAYRTVAERMLFDLLHSSGSEPLSLTQRPIRTVAAKYMQRGSELREYETGEALVPLGLNSGRPAAWPELPVIDPPAAPPAIPEPLVQEPSTPEPAVAAPFTPEAPAPIPASQPTVAPSLTHAPRADGSWAGSTSKWDVRLTVAGGHFEGSALCRLRNLRYRIEGRVAADGTVQGSAKAGRATFPPVTAHIRGQWPTVILPAAVHCTEESLTLTPS